MFCRFTENNMSALIDGELKGLKQSAVRAHLRACPACRTKYSYLGSVSAASALLVSDLPPAGFEDRVMAKVALDGTPYFAREKAGLPSFNLRFAAASVGLLLLLAAGLVFYRPAVRVMVPEATISRQTGLDTEAVESVLNSSAIGFATLASQTGR